MTEYTLLEKRLINREIERCGCICHEQEVTHLTNCCRVKNMKLFIITETEDN